MKANCRTIIQAKEAQRKLVMLTAYDYPTARMLDEAGVDMILVGDSLSMVVLGHPDTTAVSLEEMLHHTKAARRGTKRALLIGDLPAVSFDKTPQETLQDAQRFVDEAGCDGVKVEWKEGIIPLIEKMRSQDIEVMGHVGLTPQTAAAEGGYGMRGKDVDSARRIIDQARQLEAAGCFALVLECIPTQLAGHLSRMLKIPTIGIGSGADCDGQVIVSHDLFGLFEDFTPRFVKRYVTMGSQIREATQQFCRDVREGSFPGAQHSVTMSEAVWRELSGEV